MNGVEATFWFICFATATLECFARADENSTEFQISNETLQFDISRGVKLCIGNDRASITVRMSTLLEENEVEQRNKGRLKFQNGIFKRIGMGMMMVPVMYQLVSLPGTLASIKMSLLRSLFIGKIALAVMLYSAIRNSQKSEVVLVHKPEYHDHYYNTHHTEEDDGGGWWGREMKRRSFSR